MQEAKELKVEAVRAYQPIEAKESRKELHKAEQVQLPQKSVQSYLGSYDVIRQQDPALIPMPRPTLAMLNYMSKSHYLPESVQERFTQMAAQLDSIPKNSEVTRALKDLSMAVSYISSVNRELQRGYPPKYFPDLTQAYQMTKEKVFKGDNPFTVNTIMAELSVIVGQVTGVRGDDALEKMHLDMQNKPLLKDYDYMV